MLSREIVINLDIYRRGGWLHGEKQTRKKKIKKRGLNCVLVAGDSWLVIIISRE